MSDQEREPTDVKPEAPAPSLREDRQNRDNERERRGSPVPLERAVPDPDRLERR
jgi:hypothetical protein